MITVGIGQHVKCFLRSGMVLEGIVEESTGAQVVLRSLQDESLMIIHRPGEDIMLTKVMPEGESQEVPVDNNPKDPALVVTMSPNIPIKEQVRSKLNEALQTEDPELQKLSIDELRQLVKEQDRQIIAQKRREHFGSPGNAKMTHYSSPYQPGKIPSWAYGRPPRKGE